MKCLSHIIFGYLILSFIIATPKLQTYTNIQVPADLQTTDLFSIIQDSNYIYAKIIITANKTGSRLPSPMAGKSNPSVIKQSHNFAPVPDLKNGTEQEFKNYLSAIKCTPEQALNWHAAYINSEFIAVIKKLPGYSEKLKTLKLNLARQWKVIELYNRAIGMQPKNFARYIDRLYADELQAQENISTQATKQRLAAAKFAQQQLQAAVQQVWWANCNLLQQDVAEWQKLSIIFAENKFGDSTRLQKRMTVLSQLGGNSDSSTTSTNDLGSYCTAGSSANNNFTNQTYNISPEINNILRDTGLNSTDYSSCYGNPLKIVTYLKGCQGLN